MGSEMLLGEIAEIVMGQSPSGETCNNAGNGIPLLNGPTEFGPKHPVPVQYTTDAKRLGKEGDLLFCVRGSTTGKMNWANQTYAIGRGLAAIRGKNNYPNSYIRAAIELELNSLLNQATGSTFPNVSKDQLNAISLTKTSPEAATDIALIIEPIDDRITLLRETNATLEAIAQALFKSWFVDFDPVRAKAEGREPEGMPAEVADLFPSEFEETELGEIPKGWKVCSLDQIAKFLNGLAMQKFPVEAGVETLPVIKIAQLRKGDTIGADKASSNIKPEYVVYDGDVLFSWSGSLEVEIWCGGKGALNQHLFKVSSDEYPKWFYYLWTKHHLANFREIAAGKATTMGHIQRHHLVEAKVITPSPKLLAEMSAVILPVMDRAIECMLQIKTLTELRDTLLPRLMSGKLRIPDLEEQAA
ncbi:HsdS Restriction endonuclease S subunits [Methylophilaceae bacterium]